MGVGWISTNQAINVPLRRQQHQRTLLTLSNRESYFPRVHFTNMALAAHFGDSPDFKGIIKTMEISTQIAKEILKAKQAICVTRDKIPIRNPWMKMWSQRYNRDSRELQECGMKPKAAGSKHNTHTYKHTHPYSYRFKWWETQIFFPPIWSCLFPRFIKISIAHFNNNSSILLNML